MIAVYGVAEAVDALLAARDSAPGGEPGGSESSMSAAAAAPAAGGGHDPAGDREDEDRCEAVHVCCFGP